MADDLVELAEVVALEARALELGYGSLSWVLGCYRHRETLARRLSRDRLQSQVRPVACDHDLELLEITVQRPHSS
jgi:hypothetical protein